MPKNQEEIQNFINALRDAGYDPKSYSGRGMYGKCCVSLRDGEDGDRLSAWNVAKSLWWNTPDGEAMDIPEPHQDQLGLGIILYWPSYEWPKDEGE